MTRHIVRRAGGVAILAALLFVPISRAAAQELATTFDQLRFRVGPGDTIYVTVDTAGSGPATVKAKWTYTKGGQTTVVKEDMQTITATGPAVTEFHISEPKGWPAGDYQVEVLVDDKSAGTKTFTVK